MKKVDRIISGIYPNKIESTGRDCIFPREQHPDTRTNQEFLRDLHYKMQFKNMNHKGPKGDEVFCITTGEKFASQVKAADYFGISRTNICRHLAGKLESVNGLKFIVLSKN